MGGIERGSELGHLSRHTLHRLDQLFVPRVVVEFIDCFERRNSAHRVDCLLGIDRHQRTQRRYVAEFLELRDRDDRVEEDMSPATVRRTITALST